MLHDYQNSFSICMHFNSKYYNMFQNLNIYIWKLYIYFNIYQ